MDGLWQDMRYAVRKLSRQPGFTLAALLTLVLGIGANAMLFTLLNGLLLRKPAAVTAPERLVWVHTADYSSGPLGTSSYPDFEEFAKAKDAFSGVTATFLTSATTGTVDAPARVGSEFVTESYFSVFGVPL